MSRRIILFELNEVPFRILDDFARTHPHSALARLMPRMAQYETVAEEPVTLSPWITWPSLHRGVSSERHGIFHLGQPADAVDRDFPPLWQRLSLAGIRTGVFGSLHSHPLPKDLSGYSFFFPDTFAVESDTFPDEFSAFQAVNLELARESAKNVSDRVPWKEGLLLLAKAPGLGLRPGTLAGAAAQVAAERIVPRRKIRRRTWQVVLAFDLFMRQLQRRRPDFATFFTNHVASSMHRYWAAAYPGDYASYEYDEPWRSAHEGEIRFCMARFDRMLATLARHVEADPSCLLVIASSMGQAATRARPVRTQVEIFDVARLMAGIGVPEGHWRREPAMLPQCNVVVSPEWRGRFSARLAQVRIAGREIERDEQGDGFFCLGFGHEDVKEAPDLLTIDGVPRPLAELGLVNLTLDDATSCSAYDVPEGSLLVLDPARRSPPPPRTQVHALDVAPSILRNFGITPPDTMRRGFALA